MSANAALLVLFALAPPAPAQDPLPEKGFRLLVDGDLRHGWRSASPDEVRAVAPAARGRSTDAVDLDGSWRAEGRDLIGEGARAVLVAHETFADFELRARYQISAAAEAALILRGAAIVNVLDPSVTTPVAFAWGHISDGGIIYSGSQGSGGLVTNAPFSPGFRPRAAADRPTGEWNDLCLVLVGERLSLWINGVLVQDCVRVEDMHDREGALPRSGPLFLWTPGGTVRWRDLRVRAIKPEERRALLGAAGDEGFEPVFDAERGLEDWRGARAAFALEDGVLRIRPEERGVLMGTEELKDFALRFEFRIRGGTAGVALRYAGQGDPTYASACETSLAGTTGWADMGDPREVHGSARGLAAARTGVVQFPGEWNFEEVVLRGQRLTVEVNGVTLLDEDLARIDDPEVDLGCFEGRLRTSGVLAFVARGGAVELRNVRLRRLGPAWPSLEPFQASRFWAMVPAYGGPGAEGLTAALRMVDPFFWHARPLIGGQLDEPSPIHGSSWGSSWLPRGAGRAVERARRSRGGHRGRWPGVPVALDALGALWGRQDWSAEELALARACGEVLAQRPEAPELELEDGDPAANQAALARVADWFRSAMADPQVYGAAIFTSDDGPFAPQPLADARARAVREVRPLGDLAEVRLLQPDEIDGLPALETVRRGAVVRRFSLPELAESFPTFDEADPPLRLGPYGWRVHLRFGPPGDVEVASVYLDADLRPLFYHASW